MEKSKINCFFEIRADNENEKSIIYGRPIVFESNADMYHYDEIISRGALDCADLSNIVLLVNHNDSMIPLARYCSTSAQNTMELTVDENGLAFRAELDTENNPTAKELYSAIKRGDISQMSFAFTIKDEKWLKLDTDKPIRRIEQIRKVYEISAVTNPAYKDTSINARSIVNQARSNNSKTELLRKLISIL